MMPRWPQVGEYDASTLLKNTTTARTWLGMTCIRIYIYVFTTYNYEIMTCILNSFKAGCQRYRILKYLIEAVSLCFYRNYL